MLEVEVRRPHLFPARDSTAVSEATRPQAARDPEPALVWSKEASRHGVAPMACAHNRLAELATVARVPDAAGPSEETGEVTRRDLLRCLFGCGSAHGTSMSPVQSRPACLRQTWLPVLWRPWRSDRSLGRRARA